MRITKKYLNALTYQLIGCAIEVHKHPGPGLLESSYEKCFMRELDLREITKTILTTYELYVPYVFHLFRLYFRGTQNISWPEKTCQ